MDNSVLSNSTIEIYLVAGATGRCGVYIVKSLLAKNKRVRVLIRQEKKLAVVFTTEEINQLDKIIYFDLVSDTDYKQKLAECFKVNNEEGEVITYVISALDCNFEHEQRCEQGNVIANQRLIDSSVQSSSVKKFVFLSSSHVRRPYSYISLESNIRKNYMQWHKVLVEDYLRKSNLDYLIIRPVSLIESDEVSAYTISQGDKVEGQITTATVGKLVVDSMNDPWITSDSAYECITYPGQVKQAYEYKKGNYQLKAETEKEKRIIYHKGPARLVYASFWTLILFAVFLKFKFAKKYLPWGQFILFIKRLVNA